MRAQTKYGHYSRASLTRGHVLRGSLLKRFGDALGRIGDRIAHFSERKEIYSKSTMGSSVRVNQDSESLGQQKSRSDAV